MKRTCRWNKFRGGGTKMNKNLAQMEYLMAREFHENVQIFK